MEKGKKKGRRRRKRKQKAGRGRKREQKRRKREGRKTKRKGRERRDKRKRKKKAKPKTLDHFEAEAKNKLISKQDALKCPLIFVRCPCQCNVNARRHAGLCTCKKLVEESGQFTKAPSRDL